MLLTGENLSIQGKNLSQCHFVHNKEYMCWTDPEFIILGMYEMPRSLTMISMYVVFAA
jgi:hypothetical protein